MSVTRRELIAAVAAAAVTTTAGAQNAPEATSPEAEARIALILGKWGDRFTDEQKNDIRRNVRGSQSGFDALRSYHLDNSVEPATLFRVYRRTTRVRAEKS
jgi:hypothetical protein